MANQDGNSNTAENEAPRTTKDDETWKTSEDTPRVSLDRLVTPPLHPSCLPRRCPCPARPQEEKTQEARRKMTISKETMAPWRWWP